MYGGEPFPYEGKKLQNGFDIDLKNSKKIYAVLESKQKLTCLFLGIS